MPVIMLHVKLIETMPSCHAATSATLFSLGWQHPGPWPRRAARARWALSGARGGIWCVQNWCWRRKLHQFPGLEQRHHTWARRDYYNVAITGAGVSFNWNHKVRYVFSRLRFFVPSSCPFNWLLVNKIIVCNSSSMNIRLSSSISNESTTVSTSSILNSSSMSLQSNILNSNSSMRQNNQTWIDTMKQTTDTYRLVLKTHKTPF